MKKQLFLLSLLVGLSFAAHPAARSAKKYYPRPVKQTAYVQPDSMLLELERKPEAFEKSLSEHSQKRTDFLKKIITMDSEAVSKLLGYACSWDLPTVTKIILCLAHANLDSKTYGKTPLMYAALNSNSEITTLLLNKKPNLDSICDTESADTALTIALRSGQNEVASLLIQAGANVNISNATTSPLCIALWNDNEQLTQELIAAGARVDYMYTNTHSCLDIALTKSTTLCKILLEAGAKPSPLSLHLAIHFQDAAKVRLLLEYGANPNALYEDGSTALARAALLESEEIVTLLLEYGASPNIEGYNAYALAHACEGGPKIFNILKRHGATIRAHETPLHLNMVYRARTDLLTDFIHENKECINQTDSSGSSLLHVLAQSPKDVKPVIEILKGLSLDLTTTNSADKAGQHPIHYACENSAHEILEYLIELGVSINQTNQYGETPLYIAALHGKHAAVRLLLEHKADKHIKNMLGLRPIDIAYANGHKEIVRLLQDHKKTQSTQTACSSFTDDALAIEVVADYSVSDQALEQYEESEPIQPVRSRVGKQTKRGRAQKPSQSSHQKIRQNNSDLYEDDNVFALRTQDKMSTVIYKNKKIALPVKLKNIRNIKGTDDWFHNFSPEVDKRITCGTIIQLNTDHREEDQIILQDLGIKGSRGFAIIVQGKIESNSYNIRYAQLDKDMPTRGFVGAFVYLFDTDGTCYHRCFHQTRANKQQHNVFRAEKFKNNTSAFALPG